MVDETKNPLNLKNAIFMQPGLDCLDPSTVKAMKTKATRYPGISDLLPCDPFSDGKADKKKKKK